MSGGLKIERSTRFIITIHPRTHMAVTRSMTRAMNEAKKTQNSDPWQKEFDRMDRQFARRIQITARNRATNRWSGLQVMNGAKVPLSFR